MSYVLDFTKLRGLVVVFFSEYCYFHFNKIQQCFFHHSLFHNAMHRGAIGAAKLLKQIVTVQS